MAGKKLITSISRREWLIVALVSLIALVLAGLPDLYSWWLAQQRGEFWTGAQFLVPEDIGVYLNYIEQARHGDLLLANYFTTEPLLPVAQPFWLLVGWGARLLSLSAVVAYHATRLMAIPALVVGAYLAGATFFSEPRRRLLALLLFVFGSGFGVFFVPLFDGSKSVPGLLNLPVDLWVADANPFLSLLYSPHFVVSWLLIVMTLVLMYWAFERGSFGYSLAAGLCAVTLLSFHPYHAPTVLLVPLAYGLLLSARHRLTGVTIWQLAMLYGLAAPPLAYHFYLTHYGAHSTEALIANASPTPQPIHLVLGFGLVLVLAVFGYFELCRRSPQRHSKWDYLAVWAVLQLLLLYCPLSFQRRLIEGLWFPLVLLAVLGLVQLYDYVSRNWIKDRQFVLISGLCLLFILTISSNIYALRRGAQRIELNLPPFFRVSAAQAEALAWLHANTPTDAVVLSDALDGHFIAGLAGRRVYVGHWGNTLQFAAKERTAQEIIYFAEPAVRRRFMSDQGLSYIYAQRDRWAEVNQANLVPIYMNSEVVILSVNGLE